MAYTVVRGDTMGAIARKLGVSLATLTAANPQIKNINVITPGQVLNTSAGAAAPATGSGLDLNKALNSYGFVGQLANAIPDLKSILQQAVAGEWAPEQFNRAVEDSAWFKANAESVRKLATTQSLDPATYSQNLTNAASKVRLMAERMGRGNGDWNGLALQALANNWDDQQLQEAISQRVGLSTTDGVYTGDAGQLQGHLKQLAANYGVAITDAWVNSVLGDIQAGTDTIDGYENVIKARAKAQYPQLANQIDSGMTVRDIADPYIASYAQTLEVPESGVTLGDRAIQQALQVKNPDGTFSTQPMYDFVRKLKDDPRWDKTKNAEDEAYRFASSIGKSMGFVS